MTTANLIEIFCILDEFCKYFTPELKKHLVDTSGKRCRNRSSRWDRYLGMMTAMTQVPVPTTIAHGIERAGAHNGERMLSSLLF